MSEDKDATEKQIDDTLNNIMEKFDGDLPDVIHTIKFLAKIIYNLRFDLDELKLHLIKALKEDECDINHKEEEEDGRFYT